MATKNKTDEQRQRWNEYQRAYRAKHPEAVKRWNANYIRKAAAKLEAEQTEGGRG